MTPNERHMQLGLLHVNTNIGLYLLPSSFLLSWDCFTNSIFVSKCDQTGGATSYAKVGELCAGVDTIKAGCQTKDCMTPSAKKGFYRLTADLNCNRVTAAESTESTASTASGTSLSGALEGECKKTDISLVEGNARGVDWIRPEEAKRAIARCPKKRWEPITNPEKYTQYSGLLPGKETTY